MSYDDRDYADFYDAHEEDDGYEEGNTSLTKPLLVMLLMIVAVVLAVFCISGCAAPVSQSPAAIVAPTGTDINKAEAYTDSAESAVQAAVPHSDATGQADLGLASSAHKSVKTSLGSALSDLNGVQGALAAEQKQVTSLTNRVATLTASWGHRLQVIVTEVFWVLVILLAVHFVAGLVAIFFPEAAPIAGLISKVVNPFGWWTWVVSHLTAPSIVKL